MECKWSEDLISGVHWIDRQHKTLIQRLQKLNDAVDNGHGSAEVIKTIDFLESYTSSHFRHEEKYMDEYKYPEVEFHKKEHRLFLKTLAELKKIAGGNGSGSDKAKHIQYELWIYFKEHVSVIDAQLASFLKKKGAK